MVVRECQRYSNTVWCTQSLCVQNELTKAGWLSGCRETDTSINMHAWGGASSVVEIIVNVHK